MTLARQGMAIPMFSQHQSRSYRLPLTKGASMITQKRLKELFDYDQQTGDLLWKQSGGRRKIGKVAGYVRCDGYKQIWADGKSRKAHRMVWVFHHAIDIDGEIDHINGNRSDNRIENLRVATKSENQQNRKKAARINKSSGLIGVTARHNGWQARIQINGKPKHIGLFQTPEEAHLAYLRAKKELHPFSTIT